MQKLKQQSRNTADDFNNRFRNIYSDFSDESFLIIPSFVDVHVHLREPGFFYKETIHTGSKAAASAGYGHLFRAQSGSGAGRAWEIFRFS